MLYDRDGVGLDAWEWDRPVGGYRAQALRDWFIQTLRIAGSNLAGVFAQDEDIPGELMTHRDPCGSHLVVRPC